VQVGEVANVGQPLATGLSLETLRAVVDIPQRYVDTVRQQAEAKILLNGRQLEATNVIVFPYADESSHSFKTRVEFAAGLTGVYPGMFVKVAFKLGENQKLTIPMTAVVSRSEVQGVYVVGDDKQIYFRQIRTGEQHDGRIEILAGLSQGEKVALDPVNAAVLLKQAVKN
jgi:RND family efflux transporter MFP subunit